MKVLYVDCFSGISGDMMLGALLDMGIDQDKFLCELNKLGLKGYEIIIKKTTNNSIKGTDVNVVLTNDEEVKSRNFKQICEIIDNSNLNIYIKNMSKKIFLELAEAEAAVHNKKIEEIHFHEVGAVDSIIDIVGTVICIDMLGIIKIYASALHEGHGFVECCHGALPVPVPAVVQMLKNSNIPVISEDINTELVTPTGLAIIKSMSSGYGKMPLIMIEKIGYGMGKREIGRLNALRVIMGEIIEEDKLTDEILILETNIDDSTAETVGYTTEKLFEAGALDVYTMPVYMKKNRPGILITVIAKKDDESKLINILFKETSTLGVRKSYKQRTVMNREIVKISTEHGDVRVKIASHGDIKKCVPEYEDCRDMAKRVGISLNDIYKMVEENSEQYRR